MDPPRTANGGQRTMTQPPIALLDNVSYMYPRSPAPVLRDVSLTIQRGEFLGLLGPTGAGKTTLCLTLNGIVPQFFGGRFFGHATVAGLDTLEQPISRLARHVGAVFEDPETQLIATSVENEIAFALENLRVPREEILRRIPRVLGSCGWRAPRKSILTSSRAARSRGRSSRWRSPWSQRSS